MTLSKRYLWGERVDELLAQEDVTKSTSAADRVLWPVVDHLGTVRDLVKQDGTVATHFVYTGFGELVSGDTSLTRYLFTSRGFDAETGLQYNRARWYDAKTGRWISEDPLGFAAGDVNSQRYVGNGAANRIDPTGNDWLDDAANFAAGWGDTLTFGGTDKIRDGLGINGGINHNSGFYQGGQIVGNIHLGALVGAGMTAVMGRGAVLATQGLVRLGMSGSNAVATVTTALFCGGVGGTFMMAWDSYRAYQAGDWNQLAFNAGFLIGGGWQGNYSARPMANGLNQIVGQPPSSQPIGVGPWRYLKWMSKNRWRGRNYWAAMATAPDPAGAGFTAVVVPGGIAVLSYDAVTD